MFFKTFYFRTKPNMQSFTPPAESPASPRRFPVPQSPSQLTPNSNGVHIVDHPVFHRQSSHGSTNSDTSSPRSPTSGNRYPTLRNRRRGGSGSSNSSVSSSGKLAMYITYKWRSLQIISQSGLRPLIWYTSLGTTDSKNSTSVLYFNYIFSETYWLSDLENDWFLRPKEANQ